MCVNEGSRDQKRRVFFGTYVGCVTLFQQQKKKRVLKLIISSIELGFISLSQEDEAQGGMSFGNRSYY
jgi:hypothetical protein